MFFLLHSLKTISIIINRQLPQKLKLIIRSHFTGHPVPRQSPLLWPFREIPINTIHRSSFQSRLSPLQLLLSFLFTTTAFLHIIYSFIICRNPRLSNKNSPAWGVTGKQYTHTRSINHRFLRGQRGHILTNRWMVCDVLD